ncbi:MAG TPA: hypothetical protein PKI93_00875 [Alphaproteobacteria bacterium]|nr:hypothetical protein [Alphaproteobacteria bacterium]HNS43636.1 hypothetical protein [Alphaproteobacteria bacterium]
MAFGLGRKNKTESQPAVDQTGADADAPKVQSKPQPGMATKAAGELKYFLSDLTPFLPSELVGGMLPYVPGTEDEAVWNAASQACATEKVHYLYSIEGDRVWYLACPSSVMASNPDSWCPLAAALPGNSEFWDKETVYIYEKDGVATALRWDQETGRMQIFLGAARSILPRIQSMDANFITINDKVADIVPWRNRQLRTEQLARGTARILMLAGIAVSVVLMAVIAIEYIMINFLDRNLEKVKQDTETASMQLLTKAADLSRNDVLRHTVRIQQLLDDLTKVDGTLVRYEVGKDGSAEWEVLVPPAYSTGVMSIRGQAQPGIEKDGRVRVKGKN